MGKLGVNDASHCLSRLGQEDVRKVTLRTRPGEVYMLRQTHGNAVTSRNEAGNRSTPGGGPESGMFPGQPIYWVSEGMLRHSHRPRPTLGAGQGPMLKSIGQEVAKGDRQLRRVWLRE